MSYVIMQTGQGIVFQTYKYEMEEENDIRLIVKYKVDFPFEVFYINNVVLEQQTLAGMWN